MTVRATDTLYGRQFHRLGESHAIAASDIHEHIDRFDPSAVRTVMANAQTDADLCHPSRAGLRTEKFMDARINPDDYKSNVYGSVPKLLATAFTKVSGRESSALYSQVADLGCTHSAPTVSWGADFMGSASLIARERKDGSWDLIDRFREDSVPGEHSIHDQRVKSQTVFVLSATGLSRDQAQQALDKFDSEVALPNNQRRQQEMGIERKGMLMSARNASVPNF